MRKIVSFILLSAIAAARGAAPEQTADKLRSLSVLPRLSMTVRINTAELENPDLAAGTNELARRVVELEKAPAATGDEADRQERLGRYLNAIGRNDEARGHLQKAVELLTARAENRPQDGALQARLGQVMLEIDTAGAERVMRTAVKAAPEDSACWVGLGQALDIKELMVLYGHTNPAPAGTTIEKLLTSMLPKKPEPAQLEEAQACQEEADRCFDHAVALSPNEPQVLIARILHQTAHAFTLRMLLAMATGNQFDAKDYVKDIYTPESSLDLARVARLSPTNQAAIGFWGWTALALGTLPGGEGKPIDRLPEDRRDTVLEAMRRLEGLGEDANHRLAAGALESLGVLRLMATFERDAASAAFERAITLDPSREQAWEGLVALSVEGDPQELLKVCERRVKYSDTVRNEILLIKACDAAALAPAALEHARAAVRLGPNDAGAQICLAALLLRRTDAPGAEVKEHLAAALAALKGLPAGDETAQLTLTWEIDSAIAAALDGNLEAARKGLTDAASSKAADARDKDRVREIEAVLGK